MRKEPVEVYVPGAQMPKELEDAVKMFMEGTGHTPKYVLRGIMTIAGHVGERLASTVDGRVTWVTVGGKRVCLVVY